MGQRGAPVSDGRHNPDVLTTVFPIWDKLPRTSATAGFMRNSQMHRAPILTLFWLFAAHEFHQLGLCLDPIRVSIVLGPVAKLVDLVSAGSYLVFRETTG